MKIKTRSQLHNLEQVTYFKCPEKYIANIYSYANENVLYIPFKINDYNVYINNCINIF